MPRASRMLLSMVKPIKTTQTSKVASGGRTLVLVLVLALGQTIGVRQGLGGVVSQALVPTMDVNGVGYLNVLTTIAIRSTRISWTGTALVRPVPMPVANVINAVALMVAMWEVARRPMVVLARMAYVKAESTQVVHVTKVPGCGKREGIGRDVVVALSHLRDRTSSTSVVSMAFGDFVVLHGPIA
ncbi:hypothetical protein M409DRAFT_60124 [Zasmidium cellare ATCC 36951]|uniref:Uncharacterized protein n=1 Tax=Zasmidium cellare ATCC 36951 TaxID=1080233 RepID=A0A6A6C007_ZASCE|nr:uncharacterized protein M409DRAFT_60124 [Zasmidium cellare ATCC 36951]KAF2160203.1 hypothetical protein M409DRAFT_60124 [Zasmidium cellare ATCC 36951]